MKTTRIITIVGLMLLTAMGVSQLENGVPKEINMPLSAFQMKIGNWSGEVARFDQWVYEKVGMDDSILAYYQDGDGASVELYIGYYSSQREGDLPHSPRNCMVGEGWNIAEIKMINIMGASKGKPMQAVCLRMTRGNEKKVVLYWYYERGRVITSEYYKKYYLILDAITRKRTDGALIRLISKVSDSEEAALEKMTQFASELFPILNVHIPA